MNTTKLPRHRTAAGVAGIYVRISDDKEGRELGVERQIEDCRQHAARLGVQVYRVYKDNDIGASTRSSKPRPEYNQLLADAKAGIICMVIAYSSSRLTRRPMEHEGQIGLAEQFGTLFRYVRSPDFDLNTADGKQIARMLAANDAAEAERNGERVSRKRRQRVEQGKFGGGTRPYGFGVEVGTTERPNRSTGEMETVPLLDYAQIVEAEAKVVRDCAALVLANPSVPLREIARGLNTNGIPTATGKQWLPIQVRDMLLRPRNAGILVHHDEELGKITNAAGEIVPPILPEDVWRAVVDKLSDPSRRTNHGGPAPKWLGSGIYLCWKCGGVLRVHGAAQHRMIPAYRCAGGVHVTRVAAPLDRYVTEVAIARLSRPDAIDLVKVATPGVDVNALRVERDTLRQREKGLAEAFADGDISKEQLRAGTERLSARLVDIESQLNTQMAMFSPLVPLVTAADVRQKWNGLTLGAQRAAIKALMVVTVLAAPRGAGFHPEYVRVEPVSDDS